VRGPCQKTDSRPARASKRQWRAIGRRAAQGQPTPRSKAYSNPQIGPLPRRIAFFRRPESTKMRRMASAAAEKKCARFSKGALPSPVSFIQTSWIKAVGCSVFPSSSFVRADSKLSPDEKAKNASTQYSVSREVFFIPDLYATFNDSRVAPQVFYAGLSPRRLVNITWGAGVLPPISGRNIIINSYSQKVRDASGLVSHGTSWHLQHVRLLSAFAAEARHRWRQTNPSSL
jgi:hypothetical protein